MQITITVHCASFIATSCICNNFLESKYLSTATVAYLSREFLLFVKRIDHFFGGEILDFPHTKQRRTNVLDWWQICRFNHLDNFDNSTEHSTTNEKCAPCIWFSNIHNIHTCTFSSFVHRAPSRWCVRMCARVAVFGVCEPITLHRQCEMRLMPKIVAFQNPSALCLWK